MNSAYRDIADQHAMKIGFLWRLRLTAAEQSHCLPATLIRFEQRIRQHLGGLLLQPEIAWEVCEKTLESTQPEETFTSALLAFIIGDSEKTAQAVKAGFVNAKTFKALVSALGWLPENGGLKWIQPGLSSHAPDENLLAIAVCRILSHDPGEPLAHLIKRSAQHPQHPLFIQCLRLAGELKRMDLKADCHKAITADDTDVRFWGIWSSILLGEHEHALALEPYTLHTNPWQQQAIQLAFRVLPDNTADTWINHLLHHPDRLQQRCGMKAIAANGHIHRMPDLITAMKNNSQARIAGEAFSLLTGIDIKQQQLSRSGSPPKRIDYLDDSSLDIEREDSNLLWPDADKIATQWQQHSADFETGQRYFMGQGFADQVITAAHLNNIIASGYQRQRHAAALERALRAPSHLLINTRALSQETQ